MFNDAIDDQPHSQQALGFEGVDMVTPPAQLPPGLLSDATNIICDGDGLAKSRPAIKLNAFLSGATVGGAVNTCCSPPSAWPDVVSTRSESLPSLSSCSSRLGG